MATFQFYFGNPPTSPIGISLRLGTDVISGTKSIEANFGAANSLEVDLLTIASAVFAVDRGTKRGEREDFARLFELYLPIVNIGRLQPLIPIIENTLRILSNDLWSLTFQQQAGDIFNPTGATSNGEVLLFSGGLDSLAAAIDFSKGQDNLALVSHVTKNQHTITAQKKLYDILRKKGCKIDHYSFFVSSRNKGAFEHETENSQRTRSFLFLMLAAITAARLNRKKIVLIAENGQMAIHLPLSSARMAAFSTHTAHPDVLVEMGRFLSGALGIEFEIRNPYVLKTKKEVIEPIIKEAPETLVHSNSCWKSSRIPSGSTHCGECIPCFIRRIAIESYQADPTAYGRDIFNLSIRGLEPDDEGRRNLSDLAEFTLNFETKSDQDLFDEWPELYSPNINAPDVIAMYRRAASETRAVLSAYPVGKEVLS